MTEELTTDLKHLGSALRALPLGGFSAVLQSYLFWILHFLFLFAFYAITCDHVPPPLNRTAFYLKAILTAITHTCQALNQKNLTKAERKIKYYQPVPTGQQKGLAFSSCKTTGKEESAGLFLYKGEQICKN
jgi:hypothetical protein